MNRKEKLFAICKLLFAYFLSFFVEGRKRWLICEKPGEARDNGFWLYRYIRTVHPEVKCHFVLDKESSDFYKVDSLGRDNVVRPNSLKHCILFWAVEFNVSSQPFGAHPFDYYTVVRHLRFLKRKRQKVSFIHHGIVKDILPASLAYGECNIDICTATAVGERECLMKSLRYPETACILTGMCRYDNLPLSFSHRSNVILIMPTFRRWHMVKNGQTATHEELEAFRQDDVCVSYNRLLQSPRLSRLIADYGYKVIFFPHYCMQPYLSCFSSKDKNIICASRFDYDVQTLLIESDILITDYSSVFFDYAYMGKPMAFYQFDYEKYRSTQYKEGYFSYKENGFGPVVSSEESLIDIIQQLLTTNCSNPSLYQERAEQFFFFRDNNNCCRVFNSINEYK